jgi:hypothetical protein
MYVRLRLFVLVLVASVLPSLGGAQQTAARVAPASGPQLDATVTGVRRSSAQSDALNLQRRSQGVGRPVALMIVGGAAVVLGALIGGDVGLLFMIGGAVVLLIGLYRYLQ